MITGLTKEQEAKFTEYVEKFSNIELATGECNVDETIRYIKQAYEQAGERVPTKFYTYRSPLEALVGIRLYEELDGVYIADPVAYLADKPELATKVYDKNGRTRVRDSFCHGNHDVGWLSYSSFLQTELGLVGLEKINPFIGIAENCGWFSVYADVAFLQDRPEFIKLDERGLTHCETGPYLRYSDGSEIYAWHGQTVPKEWILDKSTITAEVILQHSNAEQRRAAAEILGWAEALKMMNCKIIDTDWNPYVGQLLEAEVPSEDNRVERFLKVLCGTGREFALPVPPATKTAAEAQVWLNFFDNEEQMRSVFIRT